MVGWGFIGTGGWAAGRFAPAVRAAGHRVVGGYGSSPDGSRRFAEEFGGTAYPSLAALLADDAVEAVWVASPTDAHPEHTRMAIRAGRAVLVEKPIAVDPAIARALADEVAAAEVPVGVGFQHRFNPAVTALARALDNGTVGSLSSLVLHRAVAGPSRPSGWRTDPERSGGWSIADLGTHLMDIAQSLLGDLMFWAARLSTPGRGLAVDDLSWVLLARGEATVAVRASTGTPGPESYVEASGTNGWVRVSDFWTGGGRLTDSTGRAVDLPAVDLYAAQAAAFSATVRGSAWPGATIADGLRVTEWLDAARRFDEWVGY